MKNEGFVMVDHRASPGIPAELAPKFGYHPSQVKEGALFEAAMFGCPHCGTQVVKNPMRIRERGHCFKCNDVICDACTVIMRMPDYVHHTVKQVSDMVNSGKFVMSGSLALPVFTQTKDLPDG